MSAESSRHYDVIIVGSGSGNAIPSPAYDGVRIALVEEGRFGGTCLNVGCIPTKMFVLAADAARNVAEAARLGVHAHVDSIDWPFIQKRVFGDRIDPISNGGEAYRRGDETPNIDVYDGHASFVGSRTLLTSQGGKECTITADQIIIAAGSRPYAPQVVEESGVRYYTNNDIMRIEELPREMIILGGGFIATEFAHVFSSLGVNVHVIVRSGAMNRQSDEDISARFTEVASRSWNVHLNTSIESLSEQDGIVTAALSDGSTVQGGVFLVATGRQPNGDRMNLDAAGVKYDGDHRVIVDKHGRTSAEGVWALGDVSSPHQLKHIANHEAKVVFHNVLETAKANDVDSVDLRSFDHRYVPSAIFSHPQIGQVGMTEVEAREWATENGTEITVKIQNYGDVAYGWALEDKDGFAKLIADKKTGRLLGAHFIGEQAATLVQQCIQMMAMDLDVRDVVEQQHWIHPALPELIENAILGLEFDN
ncbi:mycothione reductase [Corynebacterium sp. H113]|uniref:mycothione reductase n=1 Tax=Corynebacterium sp. H113 TaxID=3133419 RepID=UPI0030A7888D